MYDWTSFWSELAGVNLLKFSIPVDVFNQEYIQIWFMHFTKDVQYADLRKRIKFDSLTN